ncbi:hypothetical protein B23_0306 [Geobacillus thermoleovorans B23]|nr:hypothetical protein B23_0306 [Geobacillus thermoleovorans B23]
MAQKGQGAHASLVFIERQPRHSPSDWAAVMSASL